MLAQLGDYHPEWFPYVCTALAIFILAIPVIALLANRRFNRNREP